MITVFLTFLAEYLATKALDLAGNVTSDRVSNALDSLTKSPQAAGWSSPKLDDEQRHLVDAVRLIQRPEWRGWKAKLRFAAKRPIALIGPSGTGKSKIALRLGKADPNVQTDQSSLTEQEQMLAYSKFVPIVAAPGHITHGVEGLGEIKNHFESDSPPKIVCIIVCDGFHATESDLFVGTFGRPGSAGKPVAADLDKFLQHCHNEELESLRWYHESCKVKHRIPAIITIVNKRDLWGPRHRDRRIPERYTAPTSDYSIIVEQLRSAWGFGQPSTHDVISLYCHGGGFHPSEDVSAVALTIRTAQADAIVLEALLFYRYSEGTLRHG